MYSILSKKLELTWSKAGVNPSDWTKSSWVLRGGHSLRKGGGRTLSWKKDDFIQDFKISAVEQMISETADPAEMCRLYNIVSGQLYIQTKHWSIVSRKFTLTFQSMNIALSTNNWIAKACASIIKKSTASCVKKAGCTGC